MTTNPSIPLITGNLSPLERELLSYIEKLMSGLEHATGQFEALEKRSTDMITNRQAALEGSLKSLIASQATFMNAWLTFARHSNATIPAEMEEAFEMLEQAGQVLETLPHVTA